MNIIEMQDLGIVGEDLLENLEEISNSVSEIKKADFKKESTFEDTDHLQEYIEETINMIKNNLTKFEGTEDFAGATYHTGHWPHDGVDFI